MKSNLCRSASSESRFFPTRSVVGTKEYLPSPRRGERVLHDAERRGTERVKSRRSASSERVFQHTTRSVVVTEEYLAARIERASFFSRRERRGTKECPSPLRIERASLHDAERRGTKEYSPLRIERASSSNDRRSAWLHRSHDHAPAFRSQTRTLQFRCRLSRRRGTIGPIGPGCTGSGQCRECRGPARADNPSPSAMFA